MPRLDGERPPALDEARRAVPARGRCPGRAPRRRGPARAAPGRSAEASGIRPSPVISSVMGSGAARAPGPGRRPRSDARPTEPERRPTTLRDATARYPVVGAKDGPGTTRLANAAASAPTRFRAPSRSATTCGVPRVTMAPIREEPSSLLPANGTGDVSSRADIPPAECPMTSTGAPPDSPSDRREASRSARPDRVRIGPRPREAASSQSIVHTPPTTTSATPRSWSSRASGRYRGGEVRNPPSTSTTGAGGRPSRTSPVQGAVTRPRPTPTPPPEPARPGAAWRRRAGAGRWPGPPPASPA